MCRLACCTHPLARPPAKHPRNPNCGLLTLFDRLPSTHQQARRHSMHGHQHTQRKLPFTCPHAQPHQPHVLALSRSIATNPVISFHRQDTYTAHKRTHAQKALRTALRTALMHLQTPNSNHRTKPQLKPQTVTKRRCCHKPQNTGRATSMEPGLQRLPGRCVC
jgi:hypothetical protein